VRAWLRWV
jgi:hypothetical protein